MVYDVVMPAGPQKGQTQRIPWGCKCEDRKLAEQAVEKRKAAETSRMRRYFDEHSLIPEALKEATFAEFNAYNTSLRHAKGAAEYYVQHWDEAENILFAGSYGTGKSHLAVSTLKALLDRGHSGLFISVPKLLTKIRSSYDRNHDGPSESQIMADLEKIDVLVLDDIGQEHTHENRPSWAKSKLFEIVDGRQGKPTIYTTNMNLKMMQERLGEAITSRVMRSAEAIVMAADDYRQRRRQHGEEKKRASQRF